MSLAPGASVCLDIRHLTRFDYDGPVTQAHSEIRKSPINTGLQTVLSSTVSVTPNGHVSSYIDHFGNRVHHFNLLEPHDYAEVVSESRVQTTNAACAYMPAADPRPCEVRWAEFLAWSPGVPELAEYATVPNDIRMDMNTDAYQQKLVDLGAYFFNNFRYDPDVTHVHSSPKELFEHGGGVCQDMAHALIGVLRQSGIPARYVSGYIYDPKSNDMGAHLRGALATHAWVQAWHPQMGWVGIDPTNDKLVDWQYVLVSIGRDYFDVQPVHGVFMGSGGQRLTVTVSVSPVRPADNEIRADNR